MTEKLRLVRNLLEKRNARRKEERFGFEISEEDAEKLKTINDVIAYIKDKKG